MCVRTIDSECGPMIQLVLLFFLTVYTISLSIITDSLSVKHYSFADDFHLRPTKSFEYFTLRKYAYIASRLYQLPTYLC